MVRYTVRSACSVDLGHTVCWRHTVSFDITVCLRHTHGLGHTVC